MKDAIGYYANLLPHLRRYLMGHDRAKLTAAHTYLIMAELQKELRGTRDDEIFIRAVVKYRSDVTDPEIRTVITEADLRNAS